MEKLASAVASVWSQGCQLQRDFWMKFYPIVALGARFTRRAAVLYASAIKYARGLGSGKLSATLRVRWVRQTNCTALQR